MFDLSKCPFWKKNPDYYILWNGYSSTVYSTCFGLYMISWLFSSSPNQGVVQKGEIGFWNPYILSYSPWLNYVPRKMPDVRSRYALYTNMRRFIYCMLYLMYECSAAFMIRSVSLPLITPLSHDSLTKTRPLPLISVRLLFILYCYNLQTRCISLVLKFRTTL